MVSFSTSYDYKMGILSELSFSLTSIPSWATHHCVCKIFLCDTSCINPSPLLYHISGLITWTQILVTVPEIYTHSFFPQSILQISLNWSLKTTIIFIFCYYQVIFSKTQCFPLCIVHMLDLSDSYYCEACHNSSHLSNLIFKYSDSINLSQGKSNWMSSNPIVSLLENYSLVKVAKWHISAILRLFI